MNEGLGLHDAGGLSIQQRTNNVAVMGAEAGRKQEQSRKQERRRGGGQQGFSQDEGREVSNRCRDPGPFLDFGARPLAKERRKGP